VAACGARTTPRKLPIIGFFGQSTRSAASEWAAAFVQRLRELGWTDGRNVAIEYRWGGGRNERFAEIATEFVRLKVDIIVTSGTPTILAAKQATSAIPMRRTGSLADLKAAALLRRKAAAVRVPNPCGHPWRGKLHVRQETARLHHAAWRRGSGLAARDAHRQLTAPAIGFLQRIGRRLCG
jgi:hypothetical protein